MSNRVALPEPDIVRNVRPVIERNLAPRHAFKQHYDVAGRLENLIWRRRIHRSRHTGNETVGGGIIISAMGQFALEPLRPGPVLVWEFSVRGIDNDALRARC